MRCVGVDMRVLFLPDFSQNNPYQRELALALRELGLVIKTSPSLEHPLLNVLQMKGELDVLHLHWTSPFLISQHRSVSLIKAILFMFVLFYLKLVGVKIVWTVHNLFEHERRDPQLEQLFHHGLCRVYDQIIVHCSVAKEQVMTLYHLPPQVANKISVIQHGNFIDTYENGMKENEARKQLGLKRLDKVFLYFGKIRPYKGVLTLLKTFKQLPGENVRLLIVGKPETKALKAQIIAAGQSDQRICAVLDFVPAEDIQLYINAADVVVLPFRDILTSSTVVLAMSFGKAVIAPRLGCIETLLAHSDTLLYDPQKKTGLRQAMLRVLNHSDLDKIGQFNYEYISDFKWSDIARKTNEVYERCFL